MNIEKIKLEISEMIIDGTVSSSVLEKFIFHDGSVLPLESILWDYKACFDNSNHGYRKTLKVLLASIIPMVDILFMELKNKKDTLFNAIGINETQLDLQN